MFTAHLHLALWLRMSGAVALLPLCAFLAWRGSTFVLLIGDIIFSNKVIQYPLFYKTPDCQH
jgi:hypothetical protein